jgi:hypothetical protein
VWGKGQVGDKTVGVMGAQEEKVYGEKQMGCAREK